MSESGGGAAEALMAQARELLAEIEDKLISPHPEPVRDFNQVFEPGGGIEVSAQWITQSLAEQQDRIAQIAEEVQPSVIAEITGDLEADDDADPGELFALGDEEYQLIFDELFGDVFQQTADL